MFYDEVTKSYAYSDNAPATATLVPKNPTKPKQDPNQDYSDKDVRIFPPCSKTKANYNVVLTIFLCIIYGLADNLWSGTVFAAYLKLLDNDKNAGVGYVEASNGLAGLATAIPVGYLADKIGRSKVIRSGGFCLIFTVFVQIYIMQWVGVDEEELEKDPSKVDKSMRAFVAVMALWGISGGVVNGPVQALYADSTPAGKRSTYYQYQFTAYMLSSCLGPLVAIIMFQYLGDDWTLADLRIVIFTAMGLEIIAGVVMMFFDDRKALVEDDDATSGDKKANDCDQDVSRNSESSTDFDKFNKNAGEEMLRRRKKIPFILFGLGLIMSFGSGMTVKFFPLFFKDTVGLSPSNVQAIYLIVPFVMVLCSSLNDKIAKKIGRVQTCIVVKMGGLLGLYAIIFFKDWLNSRPFILVPIYIWRTGLSNSTYPLEESMLMDFVPKNQRGRWKSLESVSQFGWAGSAMLGGILSDANDGDYTFTFLITAILQTLGVVGMIFLIPLVPKDESEMTRSSSMASGTIREPLLNSSSEVSVGGGGDGDASDSPLKRLV